MNYLYHILFAINCVLIANGHLFFRGRPDDKYGMVRPPVSNPDQYFAAEEQWVEQRLNHFDAFDKRTWKQRYFVSNAYHKSGGPVFLMIGAEGEASPSWLTFGQMAENARKFNALTVTLEHRYYGKSHPTPDISTENLRYLSSEQALQDTAYFIEYLKQKLSLNSSKWIVFGGSYAGSLAAWFRLKYPNLVAGAVASSAPIEAVVNFKEYYSVVGQSLGKSCADSVREATIQLGKELKDSNDWNAIQKQFKLCYPLNGNNANDISDFVLTLANHFAGIVQYNHLQGIMTIESVCKIMENKTMGALDRYANLNEIIMKSKDQSCLNTNYQSLVTYMSFTQWTDSAAKGCKLYKQRCGIFARQWTYQTCAEFGFYATSDQKDQPFGPYFPLNYFIKQCTDIFGPKYSSDAIRKEVDSTNNFYGGHRLNVRKVVFPNGSVDPWHALGVLKDLNTDSKAILINGTAHCADMMGTSLADSRALTEARNTITKSLQQFLSQS